MSRNRSRAGTAVVSVAVLCGVVLRARSAGAQGATGRFDALQELNASVEALVQRVEQSVVQVLVTTDIPEEEGTRVNTDQPMGRQRAVGSGIAIDSGGFIVTNAHVINNASRIEVVLPARSAAAGGVRSLVNGRGRTVDATIVGVTPEIDLALLKVEDAHLPAIHMADYDGLRQGELVFAFGSPGVMVVGHSTEEGTIAETGLLAGDTIHGINETLVTSVKDLQAALDRLKPRSPVALRIERKGQLIFLAFELD
jgi:S1-C subfamily serine protease